MFLKTKILFLITIIVCFTEGFLSGYFKKLSSNKAITQQSQSPPKIPPSKNNTTHKISIRVKRGARQVYVYQDKQVLKSFPIAIGKSGWETPLGNYQVIYMKKNPIFKNFKTGNIIMPGANNPLGKRVIVFKIYKKSHLAFHGTNQDKLIGKAVSHGCIRMLNKDVIALYELVNIGTPINVLP
ncbi:L,D-transpeptidase [Nostoc punctiforme]|uniref:ErfK/YbiS/YcfS/YnhG family protein n=1 Tax=Nostoc punctiforme (strain ATCC 29133 / PCC 73102) TaxID=63737 RepID=B2J8J0_NOSP7|nr:L,D-transpeptidase [Nostoc punctiforme]ACC80967.1 ErfK/YbiS/YcfS/YnhG family protein [Nostoc punctiforme PCC 73102]